EQLFSKWWVVCVVYLLWGATLSIVFGRLVVQPNGDPLASRGIILAALQGGALVLPVIIIAVVSKFGYIIGDFGNLAEEVGLGNLGAWPATVNPLVIWSSCLGVFAVNRLANSKRPLGLNLRLSLFLTRPPTVVVAAIVGLGWLAGQIPATAG